MGYFRGISISIVRNKRVRAAATIAIVRPIVKVLIDTLVVILDTDIV